MLVYVGLGSNLGDRIAHCERALSRLHAPPDLEVLTRSSWYETKAVGAAREPFVNAVASVRTQLSAVELMVMLLQLEREAGRRRTVVHGDRTLDLDVLLAFDDRGAPITVHEHRDAQPRVTVPHPRLAERDFVLAPLVEIAPDVRLGDTPCAELLQRLAPSSRTITRVLR